MAKYVGKLYSDSYITNKVMRNPGKKFFQIITPSDISCVLSLVKNGKDMWDQDDRMAGIHMEIQRKNCGDMDRKRCGGRVKRRKPR